MNKFQEILTAWRNKWNPTEEMKKLSEMRLRICKECAWRKEVIEGINWSVICGQCGCPLDAKSHSPVKGACPLGKWNDVENTML